MPFSLERAGGYRQVGREVTEDLRLRDDEFEEHQDREYEGRIQPMATTEPSWVTKATPDRKCRKCQSVDFVVDLRSIYNVPAFFCLECLLDASQLAVGLKIEDLKGPKGSK